MVSGGETHSTERASQEGFLRPGVPKVQGNLARCRHSLQRDPSSTGPPQFPLMRQSDPGGGREAKGGPEAGEGEPGGESLAQEVRDGLKESWVDHRGRVKGWSGAGGC